jgi:hypothetical protein
MFSTKHDPRTDKKIMRKYLNDNPEQLHRYMTDLYQIKMKKTFPCK